ncbi:hypothetical protein, partial [Candidatus Albibeggiatoa sp. nov. BB20]|uniref:hypothetical protein n=1 Tax=Candidatus Albibeggiatoa sp. nov. BB20 TaxID=3162723 RepID=UPI003365A451
MSFKHMESESTNPYDVSAMLSKLTAKIDELSSDLGEQPEYPLPQRYFTDSEARLHDLSNVHILHQGVDTIKQLYKGVPIFKTFIGIEQKYKSEIGAIVNIQTSTGNYDFILGSGGKSGYTYRLQN